MNKDIRSLFEIRDYENPIAVGAAATAMAAGPPIVETFTSVPPIVESILVNSGEKIAVVAAVWIGTKALINFLR